MQVRTADRRAPLQAHLAYSADAVSYFLFSPAFSDKLLGDYVDGADLGRSVRGIDAVEAEHFAVQMVGVAALMTVPVEELGDPEGPGGVRDDLVSLTIVERLLEDAEEEGRRRAPSLLDRVSSILLRVAESPVATMAIGYGELYATSKWKKCCMPR